MLVSVNYLADLTGKDRRTIGRRLGALVATPGPNRSNQYESQEALSALYGNDDDDGARLDPQQERARLDAERRHELELRNARAHGELLPREEVAAAWSEQIGIAKGRLLSLPARVSADVLRLKSQREIEAVLKGALIVILEELAGASD